LGAHIRHVWGAHVLTLDGGGQL